MAGVKGRSGGARLGAGRPKSPPVMIGALDKGRRFGTPMAFLLAVMNDAKIEAKVRIAAARALLPYCHVPKKSRPPDHGDAAGGWGDLLQ